MAQVVILTDPVARAITFLAPYLPEPSGPYLDVPSGWDWSSQDPLVIVTDTGGAGERDVVLDDVRLTLEVSHPDSVMASRVCRELHGLMRQWQSLEPGVYWGRTIQRPTYSPDEETRTPSYSATVELTFRAEQIEINPV